MKSWPLDQSMNESRPSNFWLRSQKHGRYFENIADILSIFTNIFSEILAPRAGELSIFHRNIDNFQYFDEISCRYRPISDINDFLFLVHVYMQAGVVQVVQPEEMSFAI